MNAKLLKILTTIKEFFCKFFCKDKCHTCEDCKEWNGKVKECEKCKKGASKNNEK